MADNPWIRGGIGAAIGAVVGCALGIAPVVLWSLFYPAIDQGALLIFFTGPLGAALGGVAGATLGVLRSAFRQQSPEPTRSPNESGGGIGQS
jgi:hypothetical protein